MTRRQEEFSAELHRLLWGSLILGLVVALTAVIRLRVLERRSEHEREVAEEAEHLMRQLSQQLVAAQEEERKKLSRELHDHVGQMLTALRMELGRIDRLRSSSDSRVAGAVAEGRQLVDDMVRTVRDLALGLRPSMLDVTQILTETLRLWPTAPAFTRYPYEDTTSGGTRCPRGSRSPH